MKKYNKLDKTFGAMASSGRFIFIIILLGAIYKLVFEKSNRFYVKTDFETERLIISSIMLGLLFLGGAFVGFTTTYTKIDYKNKRIKYITKLFGIIPIGKWTHLTSDMKLGLKESTERWGFYSRSNRSTAVDYTTLKIYLYDSEGYEIIPVKKIKKAKLAEEELEKMRELLGVI